MIPNITDKVLPQLFQDADEQAKQAQNRHFSILKWYLLLLILAALLNFFLPKSQIVAVLSLVIFAATLCLLLWQKKQGYEDVWYNARAVAESVKTQAWRWMVQASPYQASTEQQQPFAGNAESFEQAPEHADKFRHTLLDIVEQNDDKTLNLSVDEQHDKLLSTTMRQARRLTRQQRLDMYVTQRVKNQREWYAKRILEFERKKSTWFWLSVGLNALAFVLLAYKIFNLEQSLPIEVISAAASGAVTWLQAKKYSELRAAYSQTKAEIDCILQESEKVVSDSQLAQFVLDSEAAFSREHTQWVARKYK